MDQIIEKLNEQRSGISIKKFQDEAILNWFSLKFNDLNKESEYLDSRRLGKVLKFRKVLIITICFNIVELMKEIILSSLGKIIFESFWFFFGFLLLSMFTLVLTYKLQKKV
jgi:type IV secretory pathway component VirB8